MREPDLHYQPPRIGEEWPAGSRPQNTTFDGRRLTLALLDQDGRFPRRIRVSDVDGNACIYVAVCTKIVEPFERSPLSFSFHDHGGDYVDMMPQEIDASDAANNTCIYVPLKLRLFQ